MLFTREAIDFAKSAFDAGKDDKEITKEINEKFGLGLTSYKQVKTMLWREHSEARKAKSDQRKAKAAAERRAIHELVAAGMCGRDIAEKLSIPRSNVTTLLGGGAATDGRKTVRAATIFAERALLEAFLSRQKKYPVEPDPILPAGSGKTLAEVVVGRECRWPIGVNEDGDQLFCGEPSTEQRKPYCACHQALSVAKQRKPFDGPHIFGAAKTQRNFSSKYYPELEAA